jgi:hypothetical protein
MVSVKGRTKNLSRKKWEEKARGEGEKIFLSLLKGLKPRI